MLCFPLPGDSPIEANPEFLRNLRLEFSLHRLIGLPLIMALVLIATRLATETNTSLGAAASIMAFILLILWGTRMSAEAVMSEVENLTWDTQRLSSMTSWGMTWGKLIGSTSFAWYGALWLVPIMAFWPKDAIMSAGEMVITSIAAQAASMLFSMLFLRLNPTGIRGLVTFSQVIGIVVGLGVLGSLFPLQSITSHILWYGISFEADRFTFASLCILAAWTIAGIHHLMRAELKYADPPYVWSAFLIFSIFYSAGFAEMSPFMTIEAPGLAMAMTIAFTTSVLLTELVALLEPKGFLSLRLWLTRLSEGHSETANTATPCWFISIITTAVLCLAAAMFHIASQNPQALPVLAAIFLFLLRDVGLIIFFTLSGRPFSGTLTSLVYLGILYLLLPALLLSANLERFLPIFIPDIAGNGTSPLMSLAPPALQAVFTWSLMAWRWRNIRIKITSET